MGKYTCIVSCITQFLGGDPLTHPYSSASAQIKSARVSTNRCKVSAGHFCSGLSFSAHLVGHSLHIEALLPGIAIMLGRDTW
jgi:hypothetical protein